MNEVAKTISRCLFGKKRRVADSFVINYRSTICHTTRFSHNNSHNTNKTSKTTSTTFEQYLHQRRPNFISLHHWSWLGCQWPSPVDGYTQDHLPPNAFHMDPSPVDGLSNDPPPLKLLCWLYCGEIRVSWTWLKNSFKQSAALFRQENFGAGERNGSIRSQERLCCCNWWPHSALQHMRRIKSQNIKTEGQFLVLLEKKKRDGHTGYRSSTCCDCPFSVHSWTMTTVTPSR
jgi:hypothetical protein